MSEIKFILFDCMETIVDVLKLPDVRMYSAFAYHGSGYEDLWNDFDSFVSDFARVKSEMEKARQKYEEYNLFDRFRLMVNQKLTDENQIEKAVDAISANYWKNYKANCYVADDVKAALADLHSKFKCGIVSNFMVVGGIEELLEIHGIDKYFDFVVTSVNIGWRKPCKEIYDATLALARVPKEQILFVGDDYVCDYVGTTSYGFNAVLLDKENVNKNADRKVQSIKELLEII
ncbi:HAD family hydrolase [Acetivibrio cellulolyticus]|uniref:HAD family hydrolase n=1 Tax=Acetivibrio cellulolyticus TaxID=35830 RepID=UPI0001E2D147|nr:HAD family hydrolase [Acetivibrio cellulolyticus]